MGRGFFVFWKRVEVREWVGFLVMYFFFFLCEFGDLYMFFFVGMGMGVLFLIVFEFILFVRFLKLVLVMVFIMVRFVDL